MATCASDFGSIRGQAITQHHRNKGRGAAPDLIYGVAATLHGKPSALHGGT
jgi:hypothetical protein